MAENVFLYKGMDINLYKASESGNAKLLDKVLKEGKVDVFHEATPARDTALHTACLKGHTQLARKLILLASNDSEAGGLFLKAQNTDGNTALHLAAERGCVKIVKMLVEKDSGLACVKNNDGETPLFKASGTGDVDIVKCLLECTPENEELDRRADGQTPLHVAVSQLRKDVTSELLDKRFALIDKADKFQRTALHILALFPLESIRYLPSFLHMLSQSKPIDENLETIGKMLLDKKISLMYRVDVNGQSALHLAAKLGNAGLVKAILSYGTDCTHIADKNGRTALHLAVEHAAQVCEKVSQYRLKPIISSLTLTRLINCSDKSGQTAFDIAIQKYEEDRLLFKSIRNYLKSCGAREKMLGVEGSHEGSPEKMLGKEGSSSCTRPESNWRLQILSVTAALITTVAFEAAFSLPGKFHSHSNSVSLSKLFVLFDSVAFSSSLGSSAILLFSLFGDQQLDPFLAHLCHYGLWLAVSCLALAFGAAIHLVVAHSCLWLAVLVWIIVCYLNVGVVFFAMNGKQFLFMEHKHYSVIWIALFTVLMMGILYAFGIPFYFVGLTVWGYLILPQWRTLVRKLSCARKKLREED